MRDRNEHADQIPVSLQNRNRIQSVAGALNFRMVARCFESKSSLVQILELPVARGAYSIRTNVERARLSARLLLPETQEKQDD
jgi:hypothetical protein